VDGTGLKEIENPSVARRMRDKVNNFNKETGIKTLPLCFLFCIFPFDLVVDALDRLLS